MYKCTECGLEYETKPDYCDCGNDEFVLTVEEKKEEIPVKTVDEPKPQKVEYKEAYHNTPAKEPVKVSYDPISIVIFVVCLILSFVIVFVWNPKNSTETDTTTTEVKTESVKIPNIDKLWKETPIKPVETKPVQTEVEKPKTTSVAQVKNVQPKKTTTTQAKKTTTSTPAKKQTQAKKPVTQTVPQKTQVQDNEAQKAAEAAKKAAEAKQKAEAEAKAAAEAAKKAAAARQEYANYKISLRNTIGKRIDFTKVIGDGSCTVSFKIDSYGNLTNRAFTKQSENLTLNNAVYKAIMATPTFTKPPVGYKNETLKLNISFNNGNFAITLE